MSEPIKLELKFDSPFLTRLLEVVASGVGAVFKPFLIRRLASANADALLIKTRAEQEARLLAAEATIELSHLEQTGARIAADESGAERVEYLRQRTLARLEQQELNRQHNIESVVAHAATQEGPPPPEQSPDPDWVARFFTSVQDVSVLEMQALWGKILAGEIRRPGTYSLRTLDVVRNLSRSEAETFASISGYLEKGSGELIFGAELATLLPSPGLDHLVEAGLLHARTMGHFAGTDTTLDYGPVRLRVVLNGPGFMDIHRATEAARELLPLVDRHERPGFVDKLVSDLERAGYKVTRLPVADF